MPKTWCAHATIMSKTNIPAITAGRSSATQGVAVWKIDATNKHAVHCGL